MPGYRKLGRPTAHRKSMLRNLVTDLFREGRIQTTDCRAKEARREAEKLIIRGHNKTMPIIFFGRIDESSPFSDGMRKAIADYYGTLTQLRERRGREWKPLFQA